MSVVVDFEETRHFEAHEGLLRRLYEGSSVEALLALRAKRNFHLTARVAGTMLGSVIAVPLEGKNDKIVQVVSLVVDPRQHRRGIGRSLLKALVQESRREHHRYVIAQGPTELYVQNEWDVMPNEDAEVALFGYDMPSLPLERWHSKRTRWIDPTALSRVPDPEGLVRLDLRFLKRDWEFAAPLR